VLALTDRLGPQLAPADEARMRARFRTTSRYEHVLGHGLPPRALARGFAELAPEPASVAPGEQPVNRAEAGHDRKVVRGLLVATGHRSGDKKRERAGPVPHAWRAGSDSAQPLGRRGSDP
jgi:hypothetical protein